MLNRLGYVSIAAILTTTTMTVGPVVFLSQQDLAETYIVMCVPVFVASFLIVPWAGLAVGAIVVLGTLVLGDASITYLSLFVFATVSVIVYFLANTVDSAYRENRYRALHDSLTDLPNRSLFTNRLVEAVERSSKQRVSYGVLFIDLDNFKVINDSLGHTGDELLVVIARRLLSCLRPADTPARLGGDEFAVVLDGIADIDDVIKVSDRITKWCRLPCSWEFVRSISARALVSLSAKPMKPTRPPSCATRMWRCTKPRRKAGAPGCSTGACIPERGSGWNWRTSFDWP